MFSRVLSLNFTPSQQSGFVNLKQGAFEKRGLMLRAFSALTICVVTYPHYCVTKFP